MDAIMKLRGGGSNNFDNNKDFYINFI